MDAITIVSAVVAFAVVIAGRVWWILPGQPGAPHVQSPSQLPPGRTTHTLIVLGSGGHTTEMFQLLAKLSPKAYSPRRYVIAATDKMGRDKIEQFEQQHKPSQYTIHVIPRSREVMQSWVTTFFTTLYALVVSFGLVLQLRPDVILCNGPGTCVPVCLSAYFLRICNIKSTSIVYIESFARVQHLSLSGKILYHLADIFLVQWPSLVEQYPKARYVGVLV